MNVRRSTSIFISSTAKAEDVPTINVDTEYNIFDNGSEFMEGFENGLRVRTGSAEKDEKAENCKAPEMN